MPATLTDTFFGTDAAPAVVFGLLFMLKISKLVAGEQVKVEAAGIETQVLIV